MIPVEAEVPDLRRRRRLEEGWKQAEACTQNGHQHRVQGFQPPGAGALQRSLHHHRLRGQGACRLSGQDQAHFFDECPEQAPRRFAIANERELVVDERVVDYMDRHGDLSTLPSGSGVP